MNTLELLYNKALMKEASGQDQNIKKTKVWEDKACMISETIFSNFFFVKLFNEIQNLYAFSHWLKD